MPKHPEFMNHDEMFEKSLVNLFQSTSISYISVRQVAHDNIRIKISSPGYKSTLGIMSRFCQMMLEFRSYIRKERLNYHFSEFL